MCVCVCWVELWLGKCSYEFIWMHSRHLIIIILIMLKRRRKKSFQSFCCCRWCVLRNGVDAENAFNCACLLSLVPCRCRCSTEQHFVWNNKSLVNRNQKLHASNQLTHTHSCILSHAVKSSSDKYGDDDDGDDTKTGRRETTAFKCENCARDYYFSLLLLLRSFVWVAKWFVKLCVRARTYVRTPRAYTIHLLPLLVAVREKFFFRCICHHSISMHRGAAISISICIYNTHTCAGTGNIMI